MVHDAHAPQITKPQPNAYIGIKWQPKENPHNITLTILDRKDWTPHKLDLATLHDIHIITTIPPNDLDIALPRSLLRHVRPLKKMSYYPMLYSR
jgi:hypothetical protein